MLTDFVSERFYPFMHTCLSNAISGQQWGKIGNRCRKLVDQYRQPRSNGLATGLSIADCLLVSQQIYILATCAFLDFYCQASKELLKKLPEILILIP